MGYDVFRKNKGAAAEQWHESEPHYIVARDLGLNTLRIRAYSNVDLDLASSRAHAICGEDGSGKTELLLTLAGRMLPHEGSLNVGGIHVGGVRGVNQIRKLSGLAFFEHVNEVQPGLSVLSVTAAELGLAGRRSNRKAAREYLDEWGLVGFENDSIESLDRYTYDLLGIALGMAANPKVLAVEEIERDLTELQKIKLLRTLRLTAREKGTTIVCGVIDYDFATAFDTMTCISVEAMEQGVALRAKRSIEALEEAEQS